MIKVSVIIPCYNVEEFVGKCIEIVEADSLKEKEIILVNDGSTDDTLKIIKEYEKKYKNIKVINQNNSGQGVARNRGLGISRGEYIMFLDSDDYIAKDTISIMYKFAKKNSSDYVYCDYYEHYNDHDKFVSNYKTGDSKKDAIVANFAPWAKLISKDLIDSINFKFCEGKIFEDVAVIPHLAASSNKPTYLNKALFYYNMTNSSTTRKKEYDQKFEDIIYISDYIYELFSNSNYLNLYQDEIKFIYLEGIVRTGVLKFADYNEGVKKINVLRKNVNDKVSHLLRNKYYRRDSFYRKIAGFIAMYFPPIIIRFIKKIKG